MNHTFTRVLALVTSSVMTTLGATASAEPSEPGVDAPTARTVEIVLVGRAGSDALLDERIRSWFGADVGLSITRERVLNAERVLGARPARGVIVWVTLRTPGSARLYFAASGDVEEPTRYLLRDVPLNDGFDEVGSERVAQVVHSSMTALSDDSVDVIARPEIERELTPPPAPVVAPPAAHTAEDVLHPVDRTPHSRSGAPAFKPLVGAFYRGALAGDEGISHGPGLVVSGTLGSGPFGVGAVARGHYVWPHTERFDDLDVALSELSARLGARGAFRTAGLELDLELGGGWASVRYDPAATDVGPVPAPGGTDDRLFGFASFGIRHALGPVDVGGRVELELYSASSHYELGSGRELAVSSRYRPAFVLELVYD